MVLRKHHVTYLVCLLIFLFTNSGCTLFKHDSNIIRPAKSLPSTTPWDLAALSRPPGYEWADRQGPVCSLYYKGLPYQNHSTVVFAYYASPATLGAKSVEEKTYPAIVLVHGGGGTAFEKWAELWAKRGYAAIAMDLAGCGPLGKRLANGGPDQSDKEKFGAVDQPCYDQWTYHAVADVILAHSLIRSFEEVDAERTAVTGISWGGYLTCIVAGLDDRFKAAVPVYGCGFLHENSVWLDQFAKMTPKQKKRWITFWEPSMYVGSAKMPMFFVNGTNDFAYPLDSYSRTYGLVKGERNFRITVDMPHSHPHGWAPKEIGLFVDQYLKGGTPLATVKKPQLINGQVRAGFKAKTNLTSASLHYAASGAPIDKLDWQSVPARIEGKFIVSPSPPENTAIWFLTATDSRDAVVSSELVFSAQ